MAADIVMPRIYKGMSEGTLVKWFKKPGEFVRDGDLLFAVMSDKGSSDIEAETTGVLTEVLVAEGEKAAVSSKLGSISPAEQPQDSDAGAKAKEQAPPSAPAAPPAQKSSPLAKKLAESAQIDLSKVPSHGRVMAGDILEYLESSDKAAPAGAAPENEPAEEIVPMNGMRKAIARNMQNSHMTSPTVTFNLSVDMTELRRCREQLKANGVKVSYTDFIVKFVAKALREFPQLNCSVSENRIIYKRYVNMGVAVSLENGLVVPNIPDADKKSLTEISDELKELAAKAREGKLPLERLQGGTFTVTNLGMYGIESFSPIINQPEVAILGVNTIEEKPVVRGGELVIRPMLNLSLTADHRVVDGAFAAQFLQRVKAQMENPALMLA